VVAVSHLPEHAPELCRSNRSVPRSPLDENLGAGSCFHCRGRQRKETMVSMVLGRQKSSAGLWRSDAEVEV